LASESALHGLARCGLGEVVYPLLVLGFTEGNKWRVVWMRSPDGAAPLSRCEVCWKDGVWRRRDVQVNHAQANSDIATWKRCSLKVVGRLLFWGRRFAT
jgi:hypothetical protein